MKINEPIVVEAQVKEPIKILDPFEANKYRFFINGARYTHTSTKADFAFSNTEVEISNNEFKSLPLDFELELTFEDLGIILGPSFEMQAGELVLYRDFELIKLGVFAEIAIDSENNEIITSGVRRQDQTASETSLSLGVFGRVERELNDGWSFLGDLRVGYYRSVSETLNGLNGTGSEINVNAAYFEATPSFYYQWSKRFKLGVGAHLLYGMGMMQIIESNGIISDTVQLSSIGLYPIKLLMEF